MVEDDVKRQQCERSLRSRIITLIDENERLKKELSSFDMAFFEQLEDMKFNYSEAKKKLEMHGIV